jgi:predicted RNA binding protein YcfA (HicA-like mRNA interferase family)
MNGYYSLVIEVLKANGYKYDRPAGGAHEMWTNGKRNQTVSKNMPSRHMANKIMSQAGIEHRFR